MHPEWARELRDAAFSRGVAFHFKQWGSWAPVVAGSYVGAREGDQYVVARGAPLLDFVPETTLGTADDVVYYAGKNSKAGGKVLDGVEYCQFPDREPVALTLV